MALNLQYPFKGNLKKQNKCKNDNIKRESNVLDDKFRVVVPGHGGSRVHHGLIGFRKDLLDGASFSGDVHSFPAVGSDVKHDHLVPVTVGVSLLEPVGDFMHIDIVVVQKAM